MIQIASRILFKQLVQNNPGKYTVIIINEPNNKEEVSNYFSYCKDFYYVEFIDTRSILDEDHPTKTQIKLILDWVKDKLDHDLIVTCQAGISRSSAVGFLVETIRSDAYEAVKILNPEFHWPNKLILKHGCEIIGSQILPPINKFLDYSGDALLSLD